MAWIPLVFYIISRSRQQHLLVWLKDRLGSLFAWLIVLSILVYVFIMSTMTIKDVSNWTNITYLPNTPNWIIVSFLAIVSFYAACSGIRTIAIVNGVLFPIVIVLGIFVATATFPHKNYDYLFPLFEFGYAPTIKGMMYATSGLTGIIYFVFMQHRIQSKLSMRVLFITGIMLVGLTLGPLMGAIAIFGPNEAARMRFPPFEQWRMVTFGHYLEHTDFFSIFQWLVGSFTRISLGMFLIPDLMNIRKEKWRIGLLILLLVLVIAASQVRVSEKKFIMFLANVYLPCSLIYFLLLSVLFLMVIFNKRKVDL
jgi:spore germination protein (amino acid permease)